MAVVDHESAVKSLQPSHLGVEGSVIRVEPSGPPLRDLQRVGLLSRPVQRLAVETRGRAELRRRLAGIERNPGGVSVHVDGGARESRAHHGRPHAGSEIIEPVDPPIRILSGQPRGVEALSEIGWYIGAGVRQADEERCVAAVDLEPTRLSHATDLA